jgi:3-methyladenine DNA glycosylase AlkD
MLDAIRLALKQAVDEKTYDNYRRFFKEDVTFYGVKSAVVDKIASEYFKKLKEYDKKDIYVLCEELLKSGYSEEAFIAAEWSYRLRDQYGPEDFPVFEGWLEKYIDNWAKCDSLCNHTLGAFIEKYPQFLKNLKDWTKSENRWLRRAAAVSLILPARKGLFLDDILQIADNLLTDKDDLVQKGYGWMLKESSRLHQDVIFRYVMKNKAIMPRTALRYAIEKMPESLKREAMSKVG